MPAFRLVGQTPLPHCLVLRQLPDTNQSLPRSQVFSEPISGLRSQSVYSFQSNLRNPYTQNFNFSIQREITPATLLTVAYVGNVSDKLLRAYDVNEVNIFAPSPEPRSRRADVRLRLEFS